MRHRLFSLYHNVRFVSPLKLAVSHPSLSSTAAGATAAVQEEGLVKAILPCTPLAIVKTLEHMQVYNTLLPYGSRAYGKTIAVINRSEVVGRPLAALLANDGARVFSVDLDGVQEFTKRRQPTESAEKLRFHAHHVVHKTSMELRECLERSDVVIAGVPSASYKIKTEWLKDGVVAINFSENKNFEADIKEKVRSTPYASTS